jgi:ribosomal protein L37AE/L43A
VSVDYLLTKPEGVAEEAGGRLGERPGRRVERGDAAMWRFKGCPKCRGDVYLDKDSNGWFEECLQCGHVQYLGSVSFVDKRAHARRNGEAVAVGARQDGSK